MEVLRTAILDFCLRKKGTPFCPSQVVKQMFPEDWELFMEDVLEEMRQMKKEGIIQVTQNDFPVDSFLNFKGPFKITRVGKLK